MYRLVSTQSRKFEWWNNMKAKLHIAVIFSFKTASYEDMNVVLIFMPRLHTHGSHVCVLSLW